MMRNPRASIVVGLCIVATAASLAESACSRSPVSPTVTQMPLLELSERLETSHFIFHYTPGDFVDARRAEAYHQWAVAFFSVTPPKKVDYWKSRDREQQYRLYGWTTSGLASAVTFAVYTYMPWMNHELCHLYTLLMGRPSTFFTEGIAEAYRIDPFVNDYEAREDGGTPLHDVARAYRREGRLVPVETITTSNGWAAAPFLVAYVESGSFVRYLCDTYGIVKMRQVFQSVRVNDTREVIATKFQAIYGISVAEAETRWQAFLEGPIGPRDRN